MYLAHVDTEPPGLNSQRKEKTYRKWRSLWKLQEKASRVTKCHDSSVLSTSRPRNLEVLGFWNWGVGQVYCAERCWWKTRLTRQLHDTVLCKMNTVQYFKDGHKFFTKKTTSLSLYKLYFLYLNFILCKIKLFPDFKFWKLMDSFILLTGNKQICTLGWL